MLYLEGTWISMGSLSSKGGTTGEGGRRIIGGCLVIRYFSESILAIVNSAGSFSANDLIGLP